jgi:hypothetical protein
MFLGFFAMKINNRSEENAPKKWKVEVATKEDVCMALH